MPKYHSNSDTEEPKVEKAYRADREKKHKSKSPSYSTISTLGEGSYGKVYKARSPNGQNVAIKRLYSGSTRYSGILFLRELELTYSLSHPYIMSCKDVMTEPPCVFSPRKKRQKRSDNVYLILDVARCDLETLIYEAESTPVSHFKRAMYQLSSAVYYLHQHGIIHRDIKPNNVLCFYENGYLTAQLCDFGAAKRYNASEANSTYVSHIQYKCPELLLENEDYDTGIDIWALACVFFEMIAKRDMFPKAPSKIMQFKEVCSVVGTPSDDTLTYLAKRIRPTNLPDYTPIPIEEHLDISKANIRQFNKSKVDGLKNNGSFAEFCDLIAQMLTIDPRDRITAVELIEHPFFKDPSVDKQEEIEMEDPVIEIKSSKDRTKALEIIYRLVDHPRIMFLALDLLDRVITSTDFVNTNGSYDKLAYVVGYMAAKYFLVDDVPSITYLFKRRCPFSNLPSLEEHVLVDVLKYRIYRPLCYDIIHNSGYPVDIIVLWKIMTSEKISGYSTSLIASSYTEEMGKD